MAPVINEEIEVKALTTVEQARAIVVTSVEQRGMAADMGRVVASLCKEATEWFRPMKQAAANAHKEICAKENSVIQPLEEAKRYLSTQIGVFDTQMEARRREEEARLQEEARKHAQAEAKRLADEQAIADAIELEAAGDTKGAAAVLANPVPLAVYVPPVVIPRAVPKSEGVSSSQVWKFRITNVDLIPREYMIPDEKAIGQVARALKNKTNIPGIEVYPEGGARFRD
jgi:hypothetical protein